MPLESEKPEAPQPETTTDDNKLSQLVNNAVTSHLKRQKTPDVDTIVSKVLEKLSSPKEETHSTEPKSTGDDALRKIEKLERKLAEQERVAAEERFLGSLKNELLNTGKVKPKAIPHIADLFQARGMIDAKSNALKIGDEALTISEGVSRFLESDDASFYLESTTAPKASLSHARNTFAPPTSKNAAPPDPSNMTKEQLYQAKMAKYMKGQF